MATDAEIEEEEELVLLEPGSVVAERYRILDIVGQGGMGIVYKAQHIHMDKTVALKTMLQRHASSSSQDFRRFQREAQAASMVDHPNIVSIHDFGYADGQAYLCMDYLEGTGLDLIIGKSPLKLDQFRHIFKQVCDALQHAHDKGLIHRDLKPSNLMVIERHHDSNFVMVLDLGLVKLVNGGEPEKSSSKLTMTNMVVGSPLYMSPEQCRALALDHRSDIYSLGCVMYEALTGVPPLRADTLFDIMSKHISEMPKPLRDEIKGVYVPSALEKVIFKAMAKSPDERYQSMSELSRAIDQAFSGAPEVVAPRASSVSQAAIPAANLSGTREKINKKSKGQNQLLIGFTIALGASILFMIPLGIMYNTNMKKNESPGKQLSPGKLNAESVPASPSGDMDSGTKPQLSSKQPFFTNSLFSGNFGKPSATSPSDAKASSLQFPAPKGLPNPGSLPGSPYVPSNATNQTNSPGNAKLTPGIEAQPEATFSSASKQPALNTLEQALNEGEFAYRKGDYSVARQKLSEALNMNPTTDVQASILAKLAICAYAASDAAGVSQYLAQFKSVADYASINGSNYMQYWDLAKMQSQMGDRDPAFSEKLVKNVIQAHQSKIISPDKELVRMRMELNRAYMEQGKMEESRQLLTDTLSDAAPFPEEASMIRAHIQRIMQRPVGGGGPFGGGMGGNGGPPSGPFNGGPPGFGGGGNPPDGFPGGPGQGGPGQFGPRGGNG